MQLQKNQDRINSTIETTLKNLTGLIDVNTVIGSPVKTEDGEYIFPVSKVTFGILSGGGEYGKINVFRSSSDLPYSAGNGSIVSIKPCGFLIKSNGEYKVVSVSNEINYETLIDKAANFISGIKTDE